MSSRMQPYFAELEVTCFVCTLYLKLIIAELIFKNWTSYPTASQIQAEVA